MVNKTEFISDNYDSDILGKKLTFFIFIMIIPLSIYSLVYKSVLLLSIMMGLGYIVSFFNLFIYVVNSYGVKLSKLIFTLSIISIQITNLLLMSFKGTVPDWQDILNIISSQLSFLIFFLLMMDKKISRKALSYFFHSFLMISLIACMFNIFWNFGEFSKFSTAISSYDISFQSFFGNRNQFGSFLFLSNIIYVYIFKLYRLKNIFVNVLLFLFINVNLMLTMSRGAILATLIFYTLLTVRGLFKARKYSFFTLICFSLLSGFVLKNSNVINFIDKFFIRSNAASSGRVDIWKLGFDIYTDGNLFFGSGFYTALDIAKGNGLEVNQFHNFFIETLIDGGIFELLLIIFSLLYTLYVIKNNKSLGSDIKSIYFFSLISLTVLLCVESVSFYGLGYVETVNAIVFITIPILMSNSGSLEKN